MGFNMYLAAISDLVTLSRCLLTYYSDYLVICKYKAHQLAHPPPSVAGFASAPLPDDCYANPS